MSESTSTAHRFYQSRVANHVAFWVLTVVLLSYYSSLFSGSFTLNLAIMCIILPIQLGATYLLVYVQIKRWLYQRRWLLFLLSALPIAYIFAVLARLTNIYIAEPLTGYEGIDESIWEVISDPIYLIKVYISWVYTPTILFLIFKMVKNHYEQESRLTELENEKSKAELNFLKAQMNPHFLFNTLNNIYALAKKQSPQTPEMILKLSDLLDYTIYECNEPSVPISKEWELIENYVDLQAVRQGSKVTIAIDQAIDDEETSIAPLILITLVENAFKHSSGVGQQPASIRISLRVEKKWLTFTVFNTKSSGSAPYKIAPKKSIGVKNVKKQLALLYSEKHTYEVEATANSYTVTLTINLG
ncbi:MAG: sensor histidine kinase [Bacteroidota bacterium]